MSTTIFESVKKGLAFIEANLQNNIGVSDVANAVAYSQFYFSREFSRLTHISIYDYILKRKISESYQCLFNSDTRIIDVAFQYGFQSHEVYTRAFRKMFKENPSEAAAFKPLAVYQPIDEDYLEFLSNLSVEVTNKAATETVFEVEGIADLGASSSLLVLLASGHLLGCKSVFSGSPVHQDTGNLSFRLCGLKHKLRIYHSNTKYAFRYFIDNFYDADEMNGNYIFIKHNKEYIDFLIPSGYFASE